MKKRSIVVVGGGTGTFTVLRGLKEHLDRFRVSAVVTMADDGGSNKILRDEFGLLPTSGIRQAIVALSSEEGLLRDLFTYRYYQGTGISGMTFGNLFMAALSDILGSQREAILETCELLGVQGRILPVSYADVRLLAKYADGTEVLGEHLIDEPEDAIGDSRIVQFRTVPSCRVDADARRAFIEANVIVLGPGDLYTNTIANLVVGGVVNAILKSNARVVFVMNLMTKYGETYSYVASDFLRDLAQYLPLSRIDSVIVNSDASFDPKLLASYAKERSLPVRDDLGSSYEGVRVVRRKVLSHRAIVPQKGDAIKRSIIRHDSRALARVIVALAGERKRG